MHDLHDSRTLPSVLNTRKAVSLIGSDISNGLSVSQIPGSPKVAIFMLMTDKTDYFTPYAHAHVG